MPPPKNLTINSTRSTKDHESEIDFSNHSKTDTTSSGDSSSEDDLKYKYDGIGIVKSLLGPSLEDAVLRTLEFGKALIQKKENEPVVKEKKYLTENKKEFRWRQKYQPLEPLKISEEKVKLSESKVQQKNNLRKTSKRRIVFTAKPDKDFFLLNKCYQASKKPPSLSKIRSLDSDLKQSAPSPEKIKKQLEALIQINKDEPPEHAGNWGIKTPKLPTEFTIMPTLCAYKNQAEFNHLSSCNLEASGLVSFMNDNELTSPTHIQTQHTGASNSNPAANHERAFRRRFGAHARLCQAPEFLSNALGPTIDISIIDNLKIMRNLFKCESGRGEEVKSVKEEKHKAEPMVAMPDYPPAEELHKENVKETIKFRGEEIKEEFKEEKMSINECFIQCPKEDLTSLQSQKEDYHSLISTKDDCPPTPNTNSFSLRGAKEGICSSRSLGYPMEELQKRVDELEKKERCLMQLIEEEERERECKRKAFEEEEKKLNNLKCCLESLLEEEKKKECKQFTGNEQNDYDGKYECLRQRIICEEEKLCKLKEQYDCYRKEIVEAKQRKEVLKRNKSLLDAWDIIASKVCHTRLPSFSRAYNLERKQLKPSDNLGNLHCCFISQGNELERPKSSGKTKHVTNSHSIQNVAIEQLKLPEINSKCCQSKNDEVPFPIQRDLVCGLHQSLKLCSCKGPTKTEGLICSSDDELLKKFGSKNKEKNPICRSRSETAMKKKRSSKIVKVMWAVTRINIFQDNCRTYEVMDATSTPPACAPVKTEGIFVVKNPGKKICQTNSGKKRICSTSSHAYRAPARCASEMSESKYC